LRLDEYKAYLCDHTYRGRQSAAVGTNAISEYALALRISSEACNSVTGALHLVATPVIVNAPVMRLLLRCVCRFAELMR
jgi:hypothetical protein